VSGFCRAVIASAFLVGVAVPLEAAVADFIGKPIVEVRLLANGADLRDPVVLEIIETRTGSPLAMIDVRESMAHLFGLGLYQDVQVDASLRGGGVVLTYNLVPATRIRRVVFEGNLALPESVLRRVVVERHGASPPVARAGQVVTTLQALYRERGYPKAEIAVRTETTRDPSNAAMVLTVRPGARARIAAIDVQGPPREPVSQLLATLEVQVGDDYDGVELDERLARYAADLRSQGFYEARATQLPRYVDADAAVSLVLSIEPGPRVEIVFQGDPLSSSDRDRLVPIAREHSVDEDLLEDSKFGIERHFRERGYCNPRADYQRSDAGPATPGSKDETNGVLRVTFTIAHGPQCIVEHAEIGGNTSFPSAELTPLVVTRAGQPFSDSTVGSDVLRIQGYYRQRGFARVKVTSQVERREPKAGSEFLRVRFLIAEGTRSLIDSVSFQGHEAVSEETLRSTVASAPGQPYFEPQIAADADKIGLLYLNRGYLEVTVRSVPRALADGAKVELTYVIQEGLQILIDHVLIVGNRRTSRETILREVQLRSGEPLSQQHEDETRARLTALGLFRRVDISYMQLPGEPTRRDVVITVDEAPVTTISYGGGLEGGKRLVRSTETTEAVEEFQFAPRGFFQVSRRNLFGKDRSLDLFTRVSFRPKGVSVTPNAPIGQVVDEGGYGFNEYLTRLTFAERRILGTDADAILSAFVEQGVRSSFDFNRRGASALLTRRLSRTVTVGARYGIDHTKLLNIKSNFAAQPEIDRLFPQVRLSSVASSVIRDTRNDLLEPNTGSLVGADAELAARRLGSEVGFLKTFLQGFTFHRLPRSSTVLALGARVGLATGFARAVTRNGQVILVDDLPASERFFAGGDTTVRGFALDRLGTPETIDQDGFPRGGHALLVLNAEVRIPVRGGLGAVAFIDGGNVFQTVAKMDLAEVRGAVGFGVRYRSPVGPIRVDLGIKLDRQVLPNGDLERPTALHISLGQAF
jgi:outer membrane protein assembly complex protein YaeT